MDRNDFSDKIGRKEKRKLKARKKKGKNLWFGLGMFGMVGWSVTIPTIAGLALGLFIDKRTTGSISWTLTLLVAGLVLGCWNAWHWINKETKEIEKERQETGDEND